jgi:hypothetical protein
LGVLFFRRSLLYMFAAGLGCLAFSLSVVG